MSIKPKACGPIIIPATRNTATSGIFVFCANSPATVPTARMSPPAISVCLAISTEAGWSNCFLPIDREIFCDAQQVEGNYNKVHLTCIAPGPTAFELLQHAADLRSRLAESKEQVCWAQVSEWSALAATALLDAVNRSARINRRDMDRPNTGRRVPTPLELVVPALCDSVRRGALAALLQFGRAVLGGHSVLLLVPAPVGHHRSHLDRDRLLRHRGVTGASNPNRRQHGREV